MAKMWADAQLQSAKPVLVKIDPSAPAVAAAAGAMVVEAAAADAVEIAEAVGAAVETAADGVPTPVNQ